MVTELSGETHDGGEGSAQLVTDTGYELVLGSHQSLQRGVGPYQLQGLLFGLVGDHWGQHFPLPLQCHRQTPGIEKATDSETQLFKVDRLHEEVGCSRFESLTSLERG